MSAKAPTPDYGRRQGNDLRKQAAMSEATSCPERWAPIVGYDGLYEVSDQGRVRSVSRWRVDSIGRKYFYKSQQMARILNSQTGRYQVRLSSDGDAKTFRLYILVLEAFVGPRPPGTEACHNDGDRTNDRLSNLRWDTSSDNRYDTVKHGRHEQANRTHCPRGHVLELPNLVASTLAYAKREGHRHRNCLACNRARSNVKRALNRGVVLDLKAVSDEHYARIMS